MTFTANIVGLGRIGMKFEFDEKRTKPASHLGAIKNNPDLKIVGICDSDTLNLKKAINYVGEAIHYFEDYKKMLKRSPADILVVATPPETHYNIVIDACAAKNKPKLIFCEKPLAANEIEAKIMVRKCKEYGVSLAVNLTRRWENIWGQAKYLSKEIGDFSFHGDFSGDIESVGIHMADLINFLGPTKTCAVNHHNVPYLLFEVTLAGEKGVVSISGNGSNIYYAVPTASQRYSGIKELKLNTQYKGNIWQQNGTPISQAYQNIFYHLEKEVPLLCDGQHGYEAMYRLNEMRSSYMRDII